MSERIWTERELERRANRRLAVLQHAEEVTHSVAETCRYFGISRNCFYRWKRRYEDGRRPGVTSKESAELKDARRRIRILEQENEILRRAAIYLGRGSVPK